MSSGWDKKNTNCEQVERQMGGKDRHWNGTHGIHSKMLKRCAWNSLCIFFVLVSFFRICTQNIRMIYFRIWFVCASSPNVIHIKWNFFFVCTGNIKLTSADPFFNIAMKSFAIFFSGIHSHLHVCICVCTLYSSFLVHIRKLIYQHEQQIFGRTKYRLFFDLFTIVKPQSLVMFLR